MFQFHIGAIKSGTPVIVGQGNSIVFQFHIGAIKRFMLVYCMYCRNTFQFHIGAIKSNIGTIIGL